MEDTFYCRTAWPPCYHEYYCSIRSLDTAQFPILAQTARPLQQRRDTYVYTYHRLVARGQNHTSQVEDTHRSLVSQPRCRCTRAAHVLPRSSPGISCMLGRRRALWPRGGPPREGGAPWLVPGSPFCRGCRFVRAEGCVDAAGGAAFILFAKPKRWPSHERAGSKQTRSRPGASTMRPRAGRYAMRRGATEKPEIAITVLPLRQQLFHTPKLLSHSPVQQTLVHIAAAYSENGPPLLFIVNVHVRRRTAGATCGHP